MSDLSSTRGRLLAGLIVAATLAFAVGIFLERSVTGETHTGLGTVQSTAGTSSESSEGSGGETAVQRSAESGDGSSATETAAARAEASEPRILGLNTESNVPVFAAIAVSLALAAGAWRSRAAVVMAGIVVLGLLFAAFDIRDVVYQAQGSRFGLVALAAIVALLHLSATVLAAMNLRANPTPIRS